MNCVPKNNSKRVAKNAVFLTLRMVFAAIVGLYTSRIVLEALGVANYGIYGLVGGIVTLSSFFNTAMAGATSRFITYEVGKGNVNRERSVFTTSLTIHLLIAVIVIVLSETIGLWYVNNMMVIPDDRIVAANIVYQLSVFSVLIGFTQVPYSAEIIAHEKMNVYAYIEIGYAILKLVVVYILLVLNTDKLIAYAAMMFILSILNAIAYRWYCVHNFEGSHIKFTYDKSIIKAMLTFSGLDLYGTACVMAKNQGQPIILNLFFGVIANAAASIALTVTGAINGLSLCVQQAFRPQIIKQYSVGDYHQCYLMTRRSSQFTLLVFAIITIPVLIDTYTILSLWLTVVPDFSVRFIRLIILSMFLIIVVDNNTTCLHATGNIKGISFITGTLNLLCPVFSFIIMKLGGGVTTGYIVNIAILFCIALTGWYLVKKQIPQFKVSLYISYIIRSWLSIILAIGLSYLFYKYILLGIATINTEQAFTKIVRLILLALFCGLTVTSISSIVAFSKEERTYLIEYVKKTIVSLFRLKSSL